MSIRGIVVVTSCSADVMFNSFLYVYDYYILISKNVVSTYMNINIIRYCVKSLER